ncbi:MAG: glycoside hydrolase family 2 TIM barrel-domain containing protein [Eubacteriales bacterium]|nr:glycoside hydrolase family 2 TIM barrel-domain containing protein [Eubacteriales bacterium]
MALRYSFNDDWAFARRDWTEVDPSQKMTACETVQIPHTWYTDGEYFRGECVYQKSFSADETRQYFIKFYGVDKSCRVLLNGHELGGHEGGYSMFAFDLTPYVQKENLLTVYVTNAQDQTVSPLSGDFTIFGGIYRRVELIETEAAHFDYTYYGTDGIEINTEYRNGVGTVHVTSHVTAGSDAKVICRLCDADGNAAAAEFVPNESSAFRVEKPHTWQGRKDPYLYQLTAELWENGRCVDTVVRTCGFREIRMDANKGFFLNEEHLKLRGVAKHQDTAGCFSAASPKEWDRDMELIEEMGANAVRLSHYQHPQYIYDKCDSMGFVVWAEIPMLKLTTNEALFANAQEQLKELILQNMHHPSIIMWGLENEIAIYGEEPYMYEKVGILHELAKKLDPYRLTTVANMNSVANDSRLNRISDVVGYNLYYGWYYGEMPGFADHMDEFHRLNPTVPVGISEYGADCNLAFHSTHPEVKDYTEEFTSLFHETVYPILAERDFVWGSFVWNMFDFVAAHRDEGGIKYRNNKGLVSHDRKICKDAFYYYKAIWSDQPFVQIAEKRFVNHDEDPIRVKVYSNCSSVMIELNGKQYTASPQNGICLFENLSLADGENTVRAFADAEVNGQNIRCTDEAVFVKAAEPDPSYIWVDPNPGINVKNWFTDEVELEKLFPADAYSIKDTINTLKECPEAMAVIDEMLPKVGTIIRDFIGTFSLEEALTFMKDLCDEETGKELNSRLIQIKK